MDSTFLIGLQRLLAEGKVPTKRWEYSSPHIDELSATDECLISFVVLADRDSLSILFQRYAQLVWSVGRRILRDKAEADDLVQEVFLYIHRKSALFDPAKGSARSWIVQVAYTQAFLRRRQLKARGFHLSGNGDRTTEKECRANSGAHYDHSLEGIFGQNGWRRVLESLSDDQRETLRLFFFEGYTFAEISRKLGQSFSCVRHHYYRGLEKLRSHLPEELNGNRACGTKSSSRVSRGT